MNSTAPTTGLYPHCTQGTKDLKIMFHFLDGEDFQTAGKVIKKKLLPVSKQNTSQTMLASSSSDGQQLEHMEIF